MHLCLHIGFLICHTAFCLLLVPCLIPILPAVNILQTTFTGRGSAFVVFCCHGPEVVMCVCMYPLHGVRAQLCVNTVTRVFVVENVR